MENLNLTYYLVDLKIKNKQLSKSTSLCLEYFRNIVIVRTIFKEKLRKAKLGKCIYFCCHPFPLGRCGLLQPPTPQHFSQQFFFIFFSLIHGYLDKGWVN